jgi:hypothetical protein
MRIQEENQVTPGPELEGGIMEWYVKIKSSDCKYFHPIRKKESAFYPCHHHESKNNMCNEECCPINLQAPKGGKK